MNLHRLSLLLVPIFLLACSQETPISVTSEHLSSSQLVTIKNNIETLYPEAPYQLKQKIADVTVKSLENMQFIEGGSFIMGDFKMPCMNDDLNRPVWRPDAQCYSQVEIVNTGAHIQHKVTLDAYSLSKYEAEMLDFDVYLQILGLPFEQRKVDGQYLERDSKDYQLRLPFYQGKPARTKSWQQAKDYCQWLGKLSGLPVDLPTEAQWEYAARSRGQNLYYATNNGFLQYETGQYYNKEIGAFEDFTDETANVGGLSPHPVGTFPPNPLGLYDMTNNAGEWVNDWYSADYYQISPEHNPQGPKTGIEKSRRGGIAMITTARSHRPVAQDIYSLSDGFRCAIQQPQAVWNMKH